MIADRCGCSGLVYGIIYMERPFCDHHCHGCHKQPAVNRALRLERSNPFRRISHSGVTSPESTYVFWGSDRSRAQKSPSPAPSARGRYEADWIVDWMAWGPSAWHAALKEPGDALRMKGTDFRIQNGCRLCIYYIYIYIVILLAKHCQTLPQSVDCGCFFCVCSTSTPLNGHVQEGLRTRTSELLQSERDWTYDYGIVWIRFQASA